MSKRKREQRTYKYECTLTGKEYRLTQKVEKTDELVSVDAFYQLNPDQDDRPVAIKKRLGVEEETEDTEETKN